MAKISCMTKLELCPFCGGNAFMEKWEMVPYEILHIPDNDGYWYAAVCNECLSEGSNCITEEDAAKAWNRRVS